MREVKQDEELQSNRGGYLDREVLEWPLRW